MTLVALSLAPIIMIVIFIYVKDKYEKEPLRLLLYSFLLGAIVSIFITTLLYYIVDKVLISSFEKTVLSQFLHAFLVVAVIEEFSKYVIVRYYLQPKRDFNEPFDGIVYAVMVSMGFAMLENLMYVTNGGVEVALIRAFTAVPAHATFGVVMGFCMGNAKFSNNRIKWNLMGLGLAILYHGAYDFFLFINFIPGIWIGTLLSLMLGIFLSHKAIKIHQNNSHFKKL